MPLYTFYPCKPDGTADTFITEDLWDDGEACVRALHLLDLHPSATSIAVWAGERKVASRTRGKTYSRAVGLREQTRNTTLTG
jgi:hypothetical protein